MFKDFSVWPITLDDGSVMVYIEQYGSVYMLTFADAKAFRRFLNPCVKYVDKFYPETKLSQKIIDAINSPDSPV